jgi:serralysin
MPVTGKGTLLRGLGGAVDLGEMAIARSDDGSVRIDASSLFDGGHHVVWHSL